MERRGGAGLPGGGVPRGGGLRPALGLMLLVALSAVVAGRAAAADVPPEHELLLFDEQVVTAAAKHPQVVADAPSWVSIVSHEDIRRFGVRTLAEALKLVPGFYGSNDRNYDYIGVRGFLRPGDYNDRILLLVNGLTYNDDVYGQAPVGYEFGIDMEAIDHIEVIRGPGSALYGGNAIFAVVNVVTFDGRTLPGTHVLGETGSFDRARGQASAGYTFGNGAELFLDGSYLSIDGPGKIFFDAFDAPETNHGVAVNLDGETAWNFYGSVRWHDLFLQGGVNRRDKDVPTAPYGTAFDVPGTNTTDGHQFAELVYQTDVAPDVGVTGRAYYSGTTYRGNYVYEAEDGTHSRNVDTADSNWYGGETRVQWTTPGLGILTAGAEYSYHPDVNQKNYDVGSPPLVDVSRSYSNWGVYLQDEIQPWPWLGLVAGARYDRYYDQDDEASPRIAVILRPQPSTNVKLLYGRAFRPPSPYEQYYGFDDPSVGQIPNPNLKPEVISTYEVDLEQSFDAGIRGVLALFHYDLDDIIDPVPIEQNGIATTQFQNGKSAHADGLDVELSAPLPGKALLRTSFSAQEVTQGGQRLSNSPNFIGKVEALVPVRLGPIELKTGAELLVVSPRKTLAGGEVGTVNQLNLNLWYDAPVPGLAFTLGLYNLLDQRPSDPAGLEHIQVSLPQDGLTFRLQVRYAF